MSNTAFYIPIIFAWGFIFYHIVRSDRPIPVHKTIYNNLSLNKQLKRKDK